MVARAGSPSPFAARAQLVERQGAGFYFKQYQPHYSNEEASQKPPYPGLTEFLEVRSGRDIFFGTGVNEGAYRRVTPVVMGDEGWKIWK